MDQTVKAEWVAALRDPARTQCTNLLKNEDAMCCLGVLCDISKIGHWDEDVYVTPESREGLVLPDEVSAWAGLNSGLHDHNPDIDFGIATRDVDGDEDYSVFAATTLNDNIGLTFPQIADVVDYFL